MKRKLIHYWRFFRRYFWCATEVGRFNMDVCVANDNEIIEIEIKVDKYDLLNDKKKKKHILYQKLRSYDRGDIPNKFYYAVPIELLEVAKDFVKDTPYGVLLVEDFNETLKKPVVKNIIRAKKIHSYKNDRLKTSIFLRMGSEVYTAQKR